MAALVIAEHDNQSLKAATLNTVTAALACSSEVDVLVAGNAAEAVAKAAAQIAGVRKVSWSKRIFWLTNCQSRWPSKLQFWRLLMCMCWRPPLRTAKA